MNIYLHEVKTKLNSVLVWSGSIAALILLFMSIFTAFAGQSDLFSSLMDSFPKELLVAFGMVDMDFSTVLGYFALLFVFVQICLAIQAANYGFGLVSVEETEWTADFLLSKPVGRCTIMTSKLLAALTALLITNIVMWVSSFVFVNIFRSGQEIATKPFVLLLASGLLFQLFFLTVGMLISQLVRRIRSVTPYAMGLVFGLYILNVFGDMAGEKSLEVISPFNHFTPSTIINQAAWDLPQVSISIAIIVVSLVVSYILYRRRNIASAV